VDSESKFLIGVNPINLNAHSSKHLNSDGALDVFNMLCQNTFGAANSILYRDEVARGERLTDTLSVPSQMSTAWASEDFSPQQSGEAPSESTELTRQKTRRELVWNSLEQDGLSLAIVAKQFGDFLDVFSPAPLLKRRIASVARKTVHRCPGYNREEITFTTSVYNSAVISHASPSLREICVVCGKFVLGEEVFSCVCGEGDDGFGATIECAVCFTWHHIQCVGIQILPFSQFVCQYCTARPAFFSGIRPPPGAPPPSMLELFQTFMGFPPGGIPQGAMVRQGGLGA